MSSLFLLKLFEENKLVKSVDLLLFSIKPRNPTQHYPHTSIL